MAEIDVVAASDLTPSRISSELSTSETEALFRVLHSLLLASSARKELLEVDEDLDQAERLRSLIERIGVRRADEHRWSVPNEKAQEVVRLAIGFLQEWWTQRSIPLWKSVCKGSFSEDHTSIEFKDSSIIIDTYQSLHHSHHSNGRDIASVQHNSSEHVIKNLIELGFYRQEQTTTKQSRWGYVFLGWGFSISAPEIRNTSSSKEYTEAANTSILSALEKEKNSARNEVHSGMASKQKEQLKSLIDGMKSFGSISETKAQQIPFSSKQIEKTIESEVDRFVNAYSKTFGAHPFFGGLKTLAKSQAGSQWFWLWKFEDAVFSHSGPPGFMEDAIRLFDTIGLRLLPADYLYDQDPSAANADIESPVEGSARVWAFDSNVSDRMLQIVRRKLPSLKKLQTRSTGQVFQSKIPRMTAEKKISSGGCCLPFF